jgi:hypothetical protein
MYARPSCVLALIAAGAVVIAASSAPALAKHGQSGGSSHMAMAHRDHDHDHDRHDKWYHHDHDWSYDRHYDRDQARHYVVRPVIANPSPPDNCLTKDYLEPDTVLFEDVCTKQWAKNSTSVSTRVASTDAKCLTKENLQGGAVLFKDICTTEWAMNPPQQALLPAD